MVESRSMERRSRVRRDYWWASPFALTCLVAIGAAVAALIGRKSGPELGPAILVLSLLSFPYIAFATTSVLRDLQIWIRRSGPVSLLLSSLYFIAAYLIYAFGTGVFSPVGLLRVIAFLIVPTALIWSAGGVKRVVWQDWIALASIWLPFNFGWIDGIWEWPQGQAGYILNTPMAVNLALVLYVGYRRLDIFSFRLSWRWSDLPLLLKALACFMIIALPIGLGTGFLALNPQLEWAKLLGSPLAIFWFIALPEELLFRGLMLGMLRRATSKTWMALVISSLLFGISHWHNPGFPDVRYVGLATLAGMFYGYTFVRSNNLTAAALLHAAVDTLWDLFFHATN